MKRPFIVFTAKQVFEAMQRAQARVVPGEVDTSDALADELNALLNERGTRVYGVGWTTEPKPPATVWGETLDRDEGGTPIDTHEALLLGQRSIEKGGEMSPKLTKLTVELLEHKYRYYILSQPILSDSEYDALEKKWETAMQTEGLDPDDGPHALVDFPYTYPLSKQAEENVRKTLTPRQLAQAGPPYCD